MTRKMNVSGTTGTSLPGIQGPKGETSRQTFYGSKKVKDSSIGRLKILEVGGPTGKFACVPENTIPQKGDFVLYTEDGQNSYTLYSIILSTPDTSIGNFTCECTIIDKFLKGDEREPKSKEIDVTIGVTPVIKTATIRKFEISESRKFISSNAKTIFYPIETSEEEMNLNMKMFNIYFYSNNDLSDDIKFVLEFTDDYSSPRTYSSLIYRFGAYGQTQGHPDEIKAMDEPILTYRGVLNAYRNQTETSSYNINISRIVGGLENKVMNYTDPESGYVPDNYCIERLDNFSITVKDFNETVEKEKLFNKDVFMPVELLSNRNACGNFAKDLSNYKIILTAYVKKTPDIYEKIFVSDFTTELKKLMGIN